jgi:hypothetical protein
MKQKTAPLMLEGFKPMATRGQRTITYSDQHKPTQTIGNFGVKVRGIRVVCGYFYNSTLSLTPNKEYFSPEYAHSHGKTPYARLFISSPCIGGYV